MAEQEEQPAKKKRTTVADLEKQLDGLQTQITHGLNPAYTDLKKRMQEVEQLIDENILDELAAHEVRIETLEKGTAAHNKTLLSDVKTRLTILEKAAKEKPDGAVTNVTDRLAALENGFLADAPATWGEIDKRLVALENAVGALADGVREITAGIGEWGIRMEEAEDSIHSLQESCNRIANLAAHTEPITLPPPIPEQEKHIDPGALKAIAAVAQNMGDVLSMTRVLQTAGGLSDDEKRQIISIACQAAGVPYSENLLVRAGVRHFEA